MRNMARRLCRATTSEMFFPAKSITRSISTAANGDLLRCCEDLGKAIGASETMQMQGIPLSRDQVYHLLRGCIKNENLGYCMRVQSLMAKNALESINVLADHLIRIFCACGVLDEANQAFNKVVKPTEHTWSAVITANSKLGESRKAIKLFDRMRLLGGRSNTFIYISVLQACLLTLNLNRGRLLHDEIIKNGLRSHIFVGSMLIDMYAKFGSLEEAYRVFDGLQDRDIVAFNALIIGFAQYGYELLALECFESMQQENIPPNKVTYLGVLKACGNMGAIEHGRQYHDQVIHGSLQSDLIMGNTVLDMYAKCGNMEEACNVFDTLLIRNVVTWGTMVAGYAQNGDVGLAVEWLHSMEDAGTTPDDMAFTAILTACSHAGLVDEGRRHFTSMRETYGIKPNNFHYTCMVDLLGRAGYFVEAENLLNFSAVRHDVCCWKSLLGSCKAHGNLKLGDQCFAKLVSLKSTCGQGYVLMSNICADFQYAFQANSVLAEEVH